LSLFIQNPLSETRPNETIRIPNQVQEKLLLPFGMVKNLYEVKIIGEHNESIEKVMRDTMAIPYDTPESCVEEATKLKDLGNTALKTDARRAIELYVEAFRKLHIICIGRRRSIWGDSWFNVQLQGGTFDGQHGQVVRMILRVRLVANTVKAYLDLEEFEEAVFWGMRTITLMREAIGEEDVAMTGFPAANEVGKIYYRTGFAQKKLGRESEARRLLRIAAEYLPNSKDVRNELASVALRLG
jgi:tetratricopeptide (TPR) repeat protein